MILSRHALEWDNVVAASQPNRTAHLHRSQPSFVKPYFVKSFLKSLTSRTVLSLSPSGLAISGFSPKITSGLGLMWRS